MSDSKIYDKQPGPRLQQRIFDIDCSVNVLLCKRSFIVRSLFHFNYQ